MMNGNFVVVLAQHGTPGESRQFSITYVTELINGITYSNGHRRGKRAQCACVGAACRNSVSSLGLQRRCASRIIGLIIRDSPDESQTGINVRVFPALLQDRREVLTATSTSDSAGEIATREIEAQHVERGK